MSQIIAKKGSFDSMHRVMNEKMKCFNIHGHTYLYELKFGYNTEEAIGYAIDFKEIKRIHMQFIDDYFDHGAILNPKDEIMIDAVNQLHSKNWFMGLKGYGEYCNPSVENIAKELFILLDCICKKLPTSGNLWVDEIVLYETPNSYTECCILSISTQETTNVTKINELLLNNFLKEKGWIEYDDRK